MFTTATFIGYVLGGLAGAALATLGIFLPAFVFVALSGPLVPRMRRSATAGAFLDGVNVASLALMAVVTWQLGRSAIVDLEDGRVGRRGRRPPRPLPPQLGVAHPRGGSPGGVDLRLGRAVSPDTAPSVSPRGPIHAQANSGLWHPPPTV